MARQHATDAVKVSFQPPPGFTLSFDGLQGHEELGRPFLFELDLTSGTLVSDMSALIGSSATVALSQSDPVEGEHTHYLNAIVTRVQSKGLARGAYRYRVELRPWIWLLSRAVDSRIFQTKSPFEIVTTVFRDAGFSDFRDRRQGASGDTTLEYCVQYRETAFDFVTRLMEQYGFYYYFEHAETKHTLVFADDPNAHTTLSHPIPYEFDRTEYRTVEDHLWEWSGDANLCSDTYTHQDYNFKTPTADLLAKTVGSPARNRQSLEVYQYPGHYDAVAHGTTLSDVRMQAIAWQRAVFQGASNSRLLHAGWRFKLEEYPDKAVNKEYLVTRADISVSIAEGLSTADEGGGETLDTYRVVIQAIPGTVPFRLEQITPRPMIRGPQTAQVTGAAGEEITTDEYGRVKVQFHWDRVGKKDENSSCWIRVAQSWAGQGWGNIFIPRIGMEVVVEFLEGDPDRPLITGVVYNAVQTVPYELPAHQTRSTVKTNSSKGGGGFNEWRFEDSAGKEEVFFQAQKDYNKTVLNNETVTIHNDTTTTVEEGNRSITVSKGKDALTVTTGDHTTTISKGNHSVTVSTGNHSTTVSLGNHSLDVKAGASDIKAMQSITLTVGLSSVKITPDSVEINAQMVKISSTAEMELSGGATMKLAAGLIAIN